MVGEADNVSSLCLLQHATAVGHKVLALAKIRYSTVLPNFTFKKEAQIIDLGDSNNMTLNANVSLLLSR